MSARPSGWTRLAAPGLIAALVFLVFAPALDAGFVSFDDPEVVTRNTAFRGLDAEHLIWMFSSGHAGHFQPLTWISLALDHAAAGLEPARYHLVNIALHALVASAFWFTAVRLLALACGARTEERGRLALAALAAALFFALHPLRVESVAWITERRDVLSGLGFVLAVGAWLRWAEPRREGAQSRPAMVLAVGAAGLAALAFRASLDLGGTLLAWGSGGPLALALAVLALAVSLAAATRISRAGPPLWFWLAALLLSLSLLSKAWAIVLPALLLVLDAWPLGRLKRERAVGLLAEKAPFFALSFAFATLAAWAQGSRGSTLATLAEHGLGERLAQGFYGLAWYPAKTVAPAQLSVIYELPAVLDPLAPRFLIPALLVVAVAVLLVALRRKLPGTLTTCVAFAVIVSPVLGIAQSGPQLVADRYSYLACLPLALLFGALVLRASRASASGKLVARGGWLVVVLLLVALGSAARARTHAWHDSTALWEAAHAVDESSPMALLNLGVAREEAARSSADPVHRKALLSEARELLHEAFALDPNPLALANLARVHGQLAELEPAQRVEHRGQAVTFAQRALELASAAGAAALDLRLNLGVALLLAGRVHAALEPLEVYARARPDDVVGQLNLGKAYGIAGRSAEAVEVLERVVLLDPESVDAWGTLGVARSGVGDREGAVEAYRRVLRLEPEHPLALQRLRALDVGP